MWVNQTNNGIPVLMYHTVGIPFPDWEWAYLTIPHAIFENHLKWLAKAGYKTVDLYELYDHVSGEKILTGKSVVLTFDDGYLDNWTFAAPLLKKYGFKATVYINPDFVDKRNVSRKSLLDVWNGELRTDELEVRGFMSWPELKKVSENGVFSVQSHLMTHTWYPVAKNVVDFITPFNQYYWMDWNQHPGNKYKYLNKNYSADLKWGMPVYEHLKSMEGKRYFQDPKEGLFLADFVEKNGARLFFDRSNWKAELIEQLEQYRRKELLNDRYESEDEFKKRIEYELKKSKEIIENKINHPVDFLGFPGGGYTSDIFDMSKEVYKSVTLSSRDKSFLRNSPGENPQMVKRIGIPYIEKQKQIFYLGGVYLVLILKEFSGNVLVRKIRQFCKLLYFFKFRLSKKQGIRYQ